MTTGQGILGNNMFAYCGNNPVKHKDSIGKSWTSVFAQPTASGSTLEKAISLLTGLFATAASDGPLPIGDAVAVVAATVVVGYGVYTATKKNSVTISNTKEKVEAIYGPPEPPKGITYYHSTTMENAMKIISSGVMTGSKWEGGYVYAWRSKPSKKAIQNSGARYGVTISFKTNAYFILDEGVNILYRMYGPVKSVNRGPIAVWDVQIVEVHGW